MYFFTEHLCVFVSVFCTHNNYTASDGEFFSIPIDKPSAARVWVDRFIWCVIVGSDFVTVGFRARFIRLSHFEPIAVVAGIVCGDHRQHDGWRSGLVDGGRRRPVMGQSPSFVRSSTPCACLAMVTAYWARSLFRRMVTRDRRPVVRGGWFFKAAVLAVCVLHGHWQSTSLWCAGVWLAMDRLSSLHQRARRKKCLLDDRYICQELNKKFITSPSFTTYSLPSARILPASFAPCSPLNWMKSSNEMVWARI